MNLVSKFLFLLAFLMLAACASGPRPGSAPTVNPEAQAVEAYRIGVDDVVRVAVWQNPDLNVTVPVRPDGRISVPLVGDVVAGGRTPEEVAAEIKTALEKFVRNPQVTVIIDQLRSHEYLARVRVTGAVRTP
ncbi:MAG: polysaccharide biosynthesis/export family protein, partial [Dokdonella sp.]